MLVDQKKCTIDNFAWHTYLLSKYMVSLIRNNKFQRYTKRLTDISEMFRKVVLLTHEYR